MDLIAMHCRHGTEMQKLLSTLSVIASSWTLRDRPLQFERSVDIDIDSQTGIQSRCIYMSRSPGNICSRIRFMQRENVALECIDALCRVELVQKSSRVTRTVYVALH